MIVQEKGQKKKPQQSISEPVAMQSIRNQGRGDKLITTRAVAMIVFDSRLHDKRNIWMGLGGRGGHRAIIPPLL